MTLDHLGDLDLPMAVYLLDLVHTAVELNVFQNTITLGGILDVVSENMVRHKLFRTWLPWLASHFHFNRANVVFERSVAWPVPGQRRQKRYTSVDSERKARYPGGAKDASCSA